jgi:FG-GAP repeat
MHSLLSPRPTLLALALLGAGCTELPNSAADDWEEEAGSDSDLDASSDETSDEEDAGEELLDGGKMQEDPGDAAQEAGGDSGSSGPCAPGQVMDCMSVCGGSARLDDCNVCNGNNASKDCAGVCGGSARPDCAGVCNGPDLPKTFYRDRDADGLGDPKGAEALCAASASVVTNRDDCDDTRKGVCSPGDVLRFKRKLNGSSALPWNQLPVVGLGDVDGDMVPDLAMAHVSATAPTSSLSIVFLQADGSIKSSRRMTAADFGTPTAPALATTLGSALAALGDIDGDNIPDLAVGEPNPTFSATDFGRVWLLFLNNTGAVKARTPIAAPAIPITTGNSCNSASIRWGDKLASFDLDRDGRLELAVGTDRDCRNSSIRVTGRIELYRLNANRTAANLNRVLWDSAPYTDAEFYEATLAGAGDADGDGVGDLAVVTPTSKLFTLLLTAAGVVKQPSRLTAASANDPTLSGFTRTFGSLPGLAAGTAPRVLFDLPALSTLGGFGATRAPSSTATPGYRVFYPQELGIEAQAAPSTGFGQAGTSLGDLERDGLPELLVTAPGDDTGGANLGAAYVLGFAASCDNQTLRGDCNASAADGCETPLDTNDHCGACGQTCQGAPHSSAGSCSSQGRCVLTCLPDYGDCNNDVRDGCETDLRTSLQHCGGCGNACPIAQHRLPTCSARTCGTSTTCEPLWSDCNTNPSDGCEACGVCGQENGGSAPAGVAPPAAPCLPDQICRRQTWRASSGQVGEFEYAACLTQCPVGRGDCNANPTDGCEANLTLQTRCGSCNANAICGIWGWLEYCVLNDQGTQYQCTD